MNTLGNTPKTICKIAEAYSINKGFVSATVLQRGTMVKLTPTGEVAPIAAVTDRPLGLVVAGSRTAGDEVTVQTEFNALVRCTADGDIVTADELAVSGIDNANEKLTQYKKAVATNFVSGMALSDASDGENVWVGIYRTSTVKA